MDAHRLDAVNNGNSVLLAVDVGKLGLGLLRHQRPHTVEIDRGAEVLVVRLVEVTHADLAEIPRMADQNQKHRK